LSSQCFAVKKEYVVYCKPRVKRGIPVVIRRGSAKAARSVAEKLSTGPAHRGCEVSRILRRCMGA
jgi:hypothetical protein